MRWPSIARMRMRIPWFAWVVLIAAILYAPSLVFGKMFLDSDMITEGYAYAAHFAGHPGDAAGARYTNAYHSGANLLENPDNTLFGFFLTWTPPSVSEMTFLHWIMFGYFLLFAWFSYLFFKDRGFTAPLASGLTAFVLFSERVMYVFSAWLWVASFFFFPAMCVFLRRLQERPSWWLSALGGLTLAFALCSSHPGVPILLLVPVGAYAFFLLRQAWKSNRGRALRFVWSVAGMLVVGIMGSWWYLAPMARLSVDTVRGAGLTFAEAQQEALLLTDLPRLVLPQWSFMASSEGLLQVAFLGMVLALLSLFRKAASPEERFWRWVVVLGLLFAVSGSPIAWLFNKIPILNAVRAPARALYVVLFGVAYLAGQGVQWLTIHRERLVRMRGWSVLKWGTIALLVGVFLGGVFEALGGFSMLASRAMAWFDAHRYAQTTGLPLEHYHDVIRSTVDQIAVNVRFSDGVTLVWFLGAVAAFLLVFVWKRPRETAIGLVLLVASGGYALALGLPRQTVDARVLQQTPASAAFVLAQPAHEPYRLFSLLPHALRFELLDAPQQGHAAPADQVMYLRDLMAVNTNIRYGIQSIDGYDNFMTRRTLRVLNAVLSETMPTGDAVARQDLPRDEKIRIFMERLNVLGMMNVKWVLTALELPDPLTLVWTGETTSRHIPVRMYENPFVLPRVFLAPQVSCMPEDEERTLEELFRPGRDFRSETILERDDCTSARALTALPDDRVEVFSYAPGQIRVRTAFTGERLLVFSELRLRGWQVTVDGAPAGSFFANYLYQGVVVPPGEHEVLFEYQRP